MRRQCQVFPSPAVPVSTTLTGFSERKFSTDNAAMIGILAERKWRAGLGEISVDAEIEPGWPL